jgi:L-alanine-DL-glutamate epimerase-like enolase superfamily enzyme
MAQVARGTSIPIATGERLTTKWEFARIIENRAATILQPDLGRSGGILETKKIAAMAEAFHIQIAPHCYCGPIVAAANIQMAATLPNFLILEAIKTFDGFHETLLKRKIEWQDGHVIPSKEPGLGVELNEAILDDYPWSGPQLHLSMVPQAVGG